MSAIAAVYNLDGRPIDSDSLSRMSIVLGHRGSDRHASINLENVALLHRMRFTTPESLIERLPSNDSSGSVFITCDARIDNREELASQLSQHVSSSTRITDSQLILAAYNKWGVDCLPRLLGDFVFVIWNARTRELLAARDPLGVKHFYYYFKANKLFALASEAKALFELEAVERRLNESFLGDYLVLNSEDKESTFFKDIKRLPSTHALLVNSNGIKVWQYWFPSSKELNFKSHTEYQDAFREKLQESVNVRLRSAYPVGSFLSGGLDSSAIVCLASRKLERDQKPPLKTFSAVFPTVATVDARIDELQYVQSVLNATRCEAHFIEADRGNPLQFLEEIFWHTENPGGATSAYMDCQVFKAAHDSGTRVLLSGIDGDSTVGYGYEDFRRMAERRMYWRLFRDASALSRNMPARKHNFKRSFWNKGIKEAIPSPLLTLWRFARLRRPESKKKSTIRFPLHFAAVKSSVKERLQIEDRSNFYLSKSFPSHESLPELHWRGLTSGHFSSVLENLEKISASFGIEVRYPFFDRRLIEFCIALPPGQRTYRGWTRSIFRHAMKGILPDDVRWRVTKSNIGSGVKVNLLKYGYSQIDDAINVNTRALERYVDLDILRKAFCDYRASPLDRDRETMLILSHVHLSNWLRYFGFA